jgi:hypothetical protein
MFWIILFVCSAIALITTDICTHGRNEDFLQFCFLVFSLLIGILATIYSLEVHPPADQCEIAEITRIKVISVEGAILAEDGNIYKEIDRWEYTNETKPCVINYKYKFSDFWHLPWYSDWSEMVLYVPMQRTEDSLAV